MIAAIVAWRLFPAWYFLPLIILAFVVERMLTLREVSKILNICYETARRRAADGSIAARRLPGSTLLRVPASEVRRIVSGSSDPGAQSDEDDDD